MKDFYPYITNDGSVGLYSPEFDDIYHSTFGAYAESCEKFVLPSDIQYYITNYKKINVLDICYGIGYNTKSFLNFFLKKIKVQNDGIDTTYSDNNSVYINAIDTDKELVFLSPFFITNAKEKPDNQILPTEKVKHISSKAVECLYEFDNSINHILLDELMRQHPEFLSDEDLCEYLNMPKNQPFFDMDSLRAYKYMQKEGISEPVEAIYHDKIYGDNIYYVNNAGNARNKALVEISYNIDDARKIIMNDNKTYQLIFLDAFTPTKCPCLWTLDFFKLLYERLDANGRILTYSNSAQIRNAFLSAGFYVGKIYNERTNTFTGTIAVKNKDFVKHDLSEYDLRLVKTRAGIFYRDENLNGLNEAIIARHKNEVDESTLISSSKFIKQYRKEHNNV